MKRFTAILICICLVFSMTACSGQQESSVDTLTQQNNSADMSGQIIDTEKPSPTDMDVADSENNILIAYFTWAENTVVENPDDIDVDATTSASVLPPGNAAKIAGWIQERIGGELFSIAVTEPYSSDYDECLERAADEKAENARSELVYHVENMEDYDTIFLGFPNWWYTVPMAVHSFLEEYDFSGKTIIPFVTHGTGGLASTIDDITAALPESVTILEPIGIYRPDVDASKPVVDEWLDGLEVNKATEEVDVKAEESAKRKITMMVNEQSISIVLYDTPAANALYDMLPLELTFEDYNGIEKISYLSEELPTEGEPDGCNPERGDFCLYAPWGNLSIFYEDFGESNGLIPLGHVENGIEILSGMDSDFSVILEAVE